MPIARSMLVLLLITSAVVAEPIPKGAKKKADYFPTSVGSRWEFVIEGTDTLDHTREVMSEEKDKDGVRLVEFQWTSHAGKYGRDVSYRIDKTGVARLGFGKDQRFAVPYLMLKADAKAGETWDAGITLPDGRDTNISRRGEIETIVTPAGRFEAISVKYGLDDQQKYWYAPNVGLVKWKNRDRLIVLSKYTAGKEPAK